MDSKAKRKTLRLLSNGVYVMTSRSGERIGAATITWLSQSSFKPSLLMAAVRKNSNVFRCFSESRVAALHIVGSHQKDIAQKFFAPTKGAEGTLNGEPFTEGKTRSPILKNLPSYVECKVIDIRDDYGDHAVVILEVVEAHFHEGTHPLTVAGSPWEYGG